MGNDVSKPESFENPEKKKEKGKKIEQRRDSTSSTNQGSKQFGASLSASEKALYGIEFLTLSHSEGGEPSTSQPKSNQQDAFKSKENSLSISSDEGVLNSYKTRDRIKADIDDRVKELQDLSRYQTDQEVGPSNALRGKWREKVRHRNANRRAYRRSQANGNIIREGQEIAKLINTYAKYEDGRHPISGHSVTGHDLTEISGLLEAASEQYDVASTYRDQEDGEKIPSRVRENAVERLQAIAGELQKRRGDLELWENLEIIGGDTDKNVSDAKVICFGENHVDPVHHEQCAKLIEFIARKGHVVVLVEGAESGEEIEIDKDKVTCKIAEDVRKKVGVFGWDNVDQAQKALGIVEKRYNLYKECMEKENVQKKEALVSQVKSLEAKTTAIAISGRNMYLSKTLRQMIEKFNDPNTKIVVIAGINHFAEEELLLRGNIASYNGIILKSRHEDEIAKYLKMEYNK